MQIYFLQPSLIMFTKGANNSYQHRNSFKLSDKSLWNQHKSLSHLFFEVDLVLKSVSVQAHTEGQGLGFKK